MALQEFQVSLLTALALRDALEVVDVPANEPGERWCALLDAGRRGRIFKDHLSVLRPAHGRRSVRECPGFLVEDRLSPTQPNDRCIAGRAVRLLADLDLLHGDLGGDMTFLSPLGRLCNP